MSKRMRNGWSGVSIEVARHKWSTAQNIADRYNIADRLTSGVNAPSSTKGREPNKSFVLSPVIVTPSPPSACILKNVIAQSSLMDMVDSHALMAAKRSVTLRQQFFTLSADIKGLSPFLLFMGTTRSGRRSVSLTLKNHQLEVSCH
jgi:hypothetical protein